MSKQTVLLGGAVVLISLYVAGTPAAAVAAVSQPGTSGRPYVSDEPNEVPPEPVRHCPNDIIVKFSKDLDDAGRGLILDKYQCSILRTCEEGGLHRVGIPSGQRPEDMVTLFQTEENVDYAELNYYAGIYFVPDDPYYSYQWNLDNSVTGGIHTERAWDIETGDPKMIIAVLDTGVAYENYGAFRQAPDLAGTAFVPGYDFVNDTAHPNDDQGHGTHVTGTIAGSANNHLGVAGVAFRCSVMPVKVLDDDGLGDQFTIAQGIYFAANHGAKVINMSFGSPQGSTTLEQAVAFAYQKGVTIVCAAGNEYQKGNRPSYPAAYDDYCLAVAATRYDGTRSHYSNTGSYIDIAAPGGDLLADQNRDGYPDGIVQQTFSIEPDVFSYFFFQGTSMAAPHVSGVAGLLISKGVTRPDEVRAAMEMTATDKGEPGWDPAYGWGIVNAFAALTYQPLPGSP